MSQCCLCEQIENIHCQVLTKYECDFTVFVNSPSTQRKRRIKYTGIAIKKKIERILIFQINTFIIINNLEKKTFKIEVAKAERHVMSYLVLTERF